MLFTAIRSNFWENYDVVNIIVVKNIEMNPNIIQMFNICLSSSHRFQKNEIFYGYEIDYAL